MGIFSRHPKVEYQDELDYQLTKEDDEIDDRIDASSIEDTESSTFDELDDAQTDGGGGADYEDAPERDERSKDPKKKRLALRGLAVGSLATAVVTFTLGGYYVYQEANNDASSGSLTEQAKSNSGSQESEPRVVVSKKAVKKKLPKSVTGSTSTAPIRSTPKSSDAHGAQSVDQSKSNYQSYQPNASSTSSVPESGSGNPGEDEFLPRP